MSESTKKAMADVIVRPKHKDGKQLLHKAAKEEHKVEKEISKDGSSRGPPGKSNDSKELREVVGDARREDSCARAWVKALNSPFKFAAEKLGDTPFPTMVSYLFGRHTITNTGISSDLKNISLLLTPLINSSYDGYSGGNPPNLYVIAQYTAGGGVEYGQSYSNIAPMWGTPGTANAEAPIFGASRVLCRGIRVMVSSPETSAMPRLFAGVIPAIDYSEVGLYKTLSNESDRIGGYHNAPFAQLQEGNQCEVGWRPTDSTDLRFDDFWQYYPGDPVIVSNAGAELPNATVPFIVVVGAVNGTIITVEYMSGMESITAIEGLATFPPNQQAQGSVCDTAAVFDKALDGLGNIATGAVKSVVDFGLGGLMNVAGGIFGSLFGAKAYIKGSSKIAPDTLKRLRKAHAKRHATLAAANVVDHAAISAAQNSTPIGPSVQSPSRPPEPPSAKSGSGWTILNR